MAAARTTEADPAGNAEFDRAVGHAYPRSRSAVKHGFDTIRCYADSAALLSQSFFGTMPTATTVAEPTTNQKSKASSSALKP